MSTLAKDLAAAVSGAVRFDPGNRALYATDASNYRHVPVGVVLPRTVDDVVATMEVCRAHDVAVLGRGGGTSLAGQCCNEAVVLDFSKHLNQVLEIDPARRVARVQGGVVLDDLRAAARSHGLTFGPDPATHNHCTLGGMIGNNSCGVHSVSTGRTADNVERLTVLTYDGLRLDVGRTSEAELAAAVAEPGRRGDIYRGLLGIRERYGDLVRARYPRIPRRVSGYNLDELLPERGFDVARALVGSESTCALVLEAEVRLVPDPPARVLLVLGYPDVYAAADDVPAVLHAQPIGLEGMDADLVDDLERKSHRLHRDDLLPAGRGWLLVEFGGESHGAAVAAARRLVRDLTRRRGRSSPEWRVYDDPAVAERVWKVRESGLGATARVPGNLDTWDGWEDAAVHPDRLGEYLRRFRALLDAFGYDASLYGHFGDGCVHTRITFDLVTPGGIATFRRFLDEAADLVVGMGGSLSGEHGDGQARAHLLPKMFGDELVGAFREFKAVWDPRGRMNPGKVVDAEAPDESLRLGAGFEPRRVRTFFQFPDDDHDFARAAERCVGIGECRRTGGGVMCPSYMATGDEMQSTRGRSRLLFELLSGRAPLAGSGDAVVRDALDLCLACKGCKSECPVNVDMATYKAEFLAHYYRRRLRPRAAYAMGLVMYGARAGSVAPAAANAVAASRLLGPLVKRAAGVAPQRAVPVLAARTFVSGFTARRPVADRAPDVVLWPDTFTNHFAPDIAWSAVSVLEQAGWHVEIPRRWVCCGRPLYDFGFLRHARRLLRRNLTVLAPAIRAGTPIVGLEPSCVSVFRDELVNLLADRRDAHRLAAQFMTFAEFLDRHDADLPAPGGRALVQPHCHDASVLDFGATRRVLERMGIDAEVPDSGCCGMAGAFGFEASHYDVSVACADRVLLPRLAETPAATPVVADGFSCREQIRQLGGRAPLHLAQLVEHALAAVRAPDTEESR